MARVLPPDSLHLVQTTAQRFRISGLDRNKRRAALSTIYDALGAKAFRQRLMVVRRIVKVLTNYHFEKSLIITKRAADCEAWFDGVADHAEALAELITQYPDDFGAFVLVKDQNRLEHIQDAHDMLTSWAGMARTYRRLVPKRAGRPKHDIYMVILIDRLRPLYQAATGRLPGRSTDPYTGKPVGSFPKMMRGVCDLGEIHKTDEAIATAIRKWQLWSKPAEPGSI